MAAKDGQSMECYANNGNSGVQNLLSQLAKLTTSLYVFDKQWHNLFVTLVLDFYPPVILDSKGNLIKPQQVSTGCQSLIC